jgi:hypothetical protein
MKMMVISLCKQTHATGRGHCADDNIRKECHTVQASDELKRLVEMITSLAFNKQVEACEQYLDANPGATECTCDSEEHVGLEWVELAEYESADCPLHAGPAEPVTARLWELLGRLMPDPSP